MKTRSLVITLFFGAFVANMNVLGLGPLVPSIAEDIDSTAPLVGQAATAALIIGAVVGLVMGPMSDHYGIRRVLVAGALLMALSGFGAVLVFDFWTLMLTRAPGGIAGGMLLGLGISVIKTRVPESEQRSAISWVVGAGALSAILGVPFLAVIADFTNWRAGFALIGVMGIMLMIAYVRMISPDGDLPAGPFRPFGIFGAYRAVLASGTMTRLQIGNLFWAVVWVGALTYLGAYLVNAAGYTLQEVGFLYMWGGAWFFIGTRVVAILMRYVSMQTIMMLAAGGLSVSLIAIFAGQMAFAGLVIMLLLMPLSGGLGLPVVTILISENTSTSPGSVMMLRQFTWGAGSAAGAAIGGALLATGGFAWVGFGLTGFAMLALLLIVLSVRAQTATTPEPAAGAGE